MSKGLGCPVGSVLVSDKATIDIARHKRKLLGGGMRQAGLLAAAALYALDHHFDRLAIDHQRARTLAERIAELLMFDFDPSTVETNLVYAKLSEQAIAAKGDAFVWQDILDKVGIRCYAESTTTLRFVTHLDLNDELLELVPARLGSLMP